MKRTINSNLAPNPIGSYSQAIISNNFLFISGQIGVNPITNELISNDIYDQLDQLMKNIKNILNSSDCGFENVVKFTVFMSDLEDFDLVNDYFKKVFGKEGFPARSVVEVSKLPKQALIKIDTVATLNE